MLLILIQILTDVLILYMWGEHVSRLSRKSMYINYYLLLNPCIALFLHKVFSPRCDWFINHWIKSMFVVCMQTAHIKTGSLGYNNLLMCIVQCNTCMSNKHINTYITVDPLKNTDWKKCELLARASNAWINKCDLWRGSILFLTLSSLKIVGKFSHPGKMLKSVMLDYGASTSLPSNTNAPIWSMSTTNSATNSKQILTRKAASFGLVLFLRLPIRLLGLRWS